MNETLINFGYWILKIGETYRRIFCCQPCPSFGSGTQRKLENIIFVHWICVRYCFLVIVKRFCELHNGFFFGCPFTFNPELKFKSYKDIVFPNQTLTLALVKSCSLKVTYYNNEAKILSSYLIYKRYQLKIILNKNLYTFLFYIFTDFINLRKYCFRAKVLVFVHYW